MKSSKRYLLIIIIHCVVVLAFSFLGIQQNTLWTLSNYEVFLLGKFQIAIGIRERNLRSDYHAIVVIIIGILFFKV